MASDVAELSPMSTIDVAELSPMMMTFATPRLLPIANNDPMADRPATFLAVPPATPFFLGVSVSMFIFLPRPIGLQSYYIFSE